MQERMAEGVKRFYAMKISWRAIKKLRLAYAMMYITRELTRSGLPVSSAALIISSISHLRDSEKAVALLCN